MDEIDWQIIVNQIEIRGVAIGSEKHPEKGTISHFCRITEIPSERGRFRPHYGDFGGGFKFCFHAHPDGIQLITQSTIVEMYRKSLTPLELILPGTIETQVPAEMLDITCPDDSQFKTGENRFGFRNKFFDIFKTWEWYSEDVQPFEFRFYPSSIGCFIYNSHIETNSLLDLTKDVNW